MNVKYKIDGRTGMALSLCPDNRVKDIMQSLYIILNTTKGTVPCYREFGISNEFMHQPMAIAKTKYIAAIADAIERFEPRATLNSVDFNFDPKDSSKLLPVLEVSING